jgi:hypothetical protein
MLLFVELLEFVKESADERKATPALVEVCFSFHHIRRSTRWAYGRLARVDFGLSETDGQPLEIEFGNEALFRKRQFLDGRMMGIPIDGVDNMHVPIKSVHVPFEEDL